jgi:hypothetical protein
LSKESGGRRRSAEHLKQYRFQKGTSGNPGGRRKGSNLPARVASLRRMVFRIFLENEEKAAEVFRQRLLSPRYQHECLEMMGRLTRELVPSADVEDRRVAVIVVGEGERGLKAGMFRQAVDARSDVENER